MSEKSNKRAVSPNRESTEKEGVKSEMAVGRSVAGGEKKDRQLIVSAKENKVDVEPVKSLVAFLDRFLERKGKILTQDKKVFERLDRDLGEDDIKRLVEKFNAKDKDLKYCLILSDFLLEGSVSSAVRIELMNFVERVLSEYSLFSGIKNNSVLQVWLQGSKNSSDKLGFFEGQFRSLTRKDSAGKEKGFTDKQVGSLLCISAAWLYFKGESDFSTLTRYLSKSAFSTKGQSDHLIEPQAFAFATSMINSTKRQGFSYFLKMVSERERSLSQKLREYSADIESKASKIFTLNKQLRELHDQVSCLDKEKASINSRMESLEADVSAHQEKARHRDTHHEDSKDELRIKLKNVLEGELRDVLVKAKKAHAKGKHPVVEYQIDDALDILERELKRVDANG
jgi:hypothetical protein